MDSANYITLALWKFSIYLLFKVDSDITIFIVYQESDRRSSAETHNASPWSWRQLTSKIRHCSIGSKVSTSVVLPMHTQILTLAKAALLIVATAIIRIFRSFTSNGISTLRGCENADILLYFYMERIRGWNWKRHEAECYGWYKLVIHLAVLLCRAYTCYVYARKRALRVLCLITLRAS